MSPGPTRSNFYYFSYASLKGRTKLLECSEVHGCYNFIITNESKMQKIIVILENFRIPVN